MVHISGSGFLAQDIVACIGGADKVVWLTIIVGLWPTIAGPPICQLADFWGRKWLVVVPTYISVVGCIAFARTNTMGAAIGTQVIAATSNGAQPILHAVVSEVLPRRYRPYAQVAINVACGLGAIMGIYVGATFVKNDPEGYRNYWYFLAGLYFAAASLVLVFYRPKVRQEQKLSLTEKVHALDLPAMFLIVVSLLTLCIALTYGDNPYPWTSARVLAPFFVGIVTLAILLCYAKFYNKEGLIHHSLYKGRNFAVAQAGVLAEGIAFLAVNNFFGFQVTLFYGQTLFRTGIIYSIIWYSYIVAAILAGIYCARTKTVKPPAIIAFVCFVIYFILMATTTVNTPLAHLWGFNVFCGFGLGLSLNPLIVVAQLSTPPKLISTATGLIIATRALGASIGLSIFNSVFNSTMSDNLVPKIQAAVTPLGLPKSSLTAFVAALSSKDQKALAAVPGVTPQIIQAGVDGMMAAYSVSFRNVYITGGCFSFVALIRESCSILIS